jgi:hypothetical protein
MDWRRPVSSRLLVFALLVAALLTTISDPDIWFDLVLGRQIATTGAIPGSEFYLYSLIGQPTTWPEWGFGLLYYGVFDWLGYWGMSLVNAVIAAGALLGFYCAAEVGRARSATAIALLAALVWVVSPRLVYRPETVLYLCLGWVIYLLERYLADRRWQRLAPLPLVGLALANIHPSVFMLLLVIGFYAVQAGWEAMRREGRAALARAVAPVALALAATGAASLLNPYGFEQIALPFRYVQSTELLSQIAEYQATMGTTLRWPFLAIAALALAAFAWGRPRRPVDALLAIAFGYLAFRYVRNVAMFALVVYVPVTRAAATVLDRAADRFAGRLGRRFVWMAALLLAGVTLVAFLTDRRWGAGLDDVSIPDRAAAVIREARLPGRIFNYYDTGGYLAWALDDDHLPFIDGRRYTNDLANATHNAVFLRGDPGWKQILDQYGVNLILTRSVTTVSGQLVPTVAFLDGDREWGLVSVEPWYYLFVRLAAIGDRPDVRLLDKDEVWRGTVQESQAIIDAFPGSSAPAWLSEGIANFKLGNVRLAANQIGRYAALRPDDREAAQLAAELEAALIGDPAARRRLEDLRQSGREKLLHPLIW